MGAAPRLGRGAAHRLETRPRELKADLVALLRPDTTLVLDLRDATFLGPAAARLLLDLRGQAAASGTRLILWRPNGQPLRTLRIVRFDRVVDVRPPSWRPEPGPHRRRDRTGRDRPVRKRRGIRAASGWGTVARGRHVSRPAWGGTAHYHSGGGPTHA